MSMLSKGLAWHSQQLTKAGGQPVVYQRGNLLLKIPDAVKGRTEFETEGDDGRVVRSIQIDWLVRAELLKQNGVLFEPEVADRIVDGNTTYEVQLFGDDPCFRRVSDDLLRIHVRQVKHG